MSNRTEVTHVHLLRSYITGVESHLRHLDSVMGSHIRQLDATLNKGAGVRPIKTSVHALHAPSDFSVNRLLSSVIGSAIRGTFGSGRGNSGSLSNGQMMSELASALSKAMRRNM